MHYLSCMHYNYTFPLKYYSATPMIPSLSMFPPILTLHASLHAYSKTYNKEILDILMLIPCCKILYSMDRIPWNPLHKFQKQPSYISCHYYVCPYCYYFSLLSLDSDCSFYQRYNKQGANSCDSN